MENDVQAQLAELQERLRQAEAQTERKLREQERKLREQAEAQIEQERTRAVQERTLREQAEAQIEQERTLREQVREQAEAQIEQERTLREQVREQAEAQIEQERTLREQAEAQREQAEAQREQAEARMAPSAFLDFIQNAEDFLYSAFYVEPDTTKSSSGTTTRVDGKCYPLFFRPWTDFATRHAATFNDFATAFADQAIFPPPTSVEAIREMLYPDVILADETDLRPFIDMAIENPAALITTKYLDRVRPYENVVGVRFKNNAYGPQTDEEGQAGEEEAAQDDGTAERPSKRRSPVKQVGIPDRWGFAVLADRSPKPIFVGEYKAAHKLTAKTLRRVMSAPPPEDFFTQAIQSLSRNTTEAAAAAPKVPGSVLVARVLCQAYHYMITTGHEFGYVASGDGLVFLRVPENDCRTLYYSWAVFPVAAIRDQDARRAANIGARTPQETALAHVASFCLWAAETTARPSSWVNTAEKAVKRWPELYDEVLPLAGPGPAGDDGDDGGGGDDGDDGDGGGGGGGGGSGDGGGGEGGDQGDVWPSGWYPRLPMSVRSRLLKRPRSPGGSGPADGATGRATDKDGGRGTWARLVVQLPTLPYCTQACLRGLSQNLPLDPKCPNVALHRSGRTSPTGAVDSHPLTAEAARALVVAQLAENMDQDCECLLKDRLYGRYGVLFKITVTGYGYTLVAKGVQAAHRGDLGKEAAVYNALTALQGRLVPVFLGIADLEEPIPLYTGARVRHMMLLSYAGRDLCATKALPAGVDFDAETERTVDELIAAGLWNDDVREANLAWNAEAGRVMQLDFDQARMLPPVKKPAAQPASGEEAKPSGSVVRSPLFEKRDFNAHVAGGQDGSEHGTAKRRRVSSG